MTHEPLGTPPPWGAIWSPFFDDFLPAQRGLSPHTVRSYRDALLLFLRFTARELRRTVDRSGRSRPDSRARHAVPRLARSRAIATASPPATRVWGPSMSLHVTSPHSVPSTLVPLQRIIGMPFKRGAIEAPIEYLDRSELDALLKSIDRSTAPRPARLCALCVHVQHRRASPGGA